MLMGTNTALQTIEVDLFRNLMCNWNGQVPPDSHWTLYRDFHKLLYRGPFMEVCQRLQLYVSDGA